MPAAPTTVEAELDRIDESTGRLRRRPAATTWSPPPTARPRWSRSTASPTASAGTRAACCVPRPRRSWSPPLSPSATRSRPAPPVLVLESMKMETVLHAPFAARVKELLVITGSQVETGAPLVRLEPVGERRPRRPWPQPVPRWTLPDPSRAAAAADRLPGPHRPRRRDPRLRRPPAPTTLPCRSTSRSGRSCGRRGRRVLEDELGCSARSPTSPSSAATSRPTRSAHRAARAQLPRALPHLPAEPRRRARRPAGALQDGCAGCSAHYGVLDLERTPELEEAVFRIFLAQQRSAPEVAIATALLGCWIAEPAPTGGSPLLARELLERLGRATQLRFPVIGDLARSVRFRWFDQPAGRRRARRRARRRPRRARRARRRRRRRPDASGSRRWPLSPSRSCRFLAERLEQGCPSGSRCSRCWPAVTTASTTSHDLRVAASRTAARSWSPTTASTTARPAWSPPSARSPSWPTPWRPGRLGRRPARRPGRRAGRGRRPLPALARRARVADATSERCARCGRAAVRPRRTTGLRGGLPRRRGRWATTPSVPTERRSAWSRTP